MNKKRIVYKYTFIVLLLSTLIISQLCETSVFAATGVSGVTSPKTSSVTANITSNLGSIQLAANIKVTLEEVNIWPQAGGNMLTYTLNYANGSSNNASLSHYFSRVVTPTGYIIPGNPITGDSLKKTISPKGTLRVTYYVNIGKSNSLRGIRIPIYIWDTNTKGYLKQMGSFKLPANYSPTVPIGQSLNTTINDVSIIAHTESLQIYKYSGKVYAKVGISLTNRGDKVFGDPGYLAYLVSASGTSFELALDSSQASYKIQPQEKKTIYYLTEIPAYLNTNQMKLQYVQKDETLKINLPKSSYTLPVATRPDLIVGKDVIKKILIQNNTINTQLVNAMMYEEDDKGMWSLSFQLRLENTGNKAVTMPSYDLAVKSTLGKSFPINAKSLNGLTLNPLEEKIVQFTAQVPRAIDQNTLQLEMIESAIPDTTSPLTESGEVVSKLILPVAYFQIPFNLRTDSEKRLEYKTTNSYGSFAYSIQSMQRFPWKDDDIVIAKLRIINTQRMSLSLPDLKGALKIGNDDLSSSTELFMDKQAAVLSPGQSVDMYVFTKIPYTMDFNRMQVTLYSTVKEEDIPFLTISANSPLDDIQTIGRGGSFMIVGKGKNAKVEEKRTTVYEGVNSNIVYTELLMSSEEKRQSKMARLQAYFKTADGEYYEATSNQLDSSMNPGGKQLISFSTKLPKSVNTSEITLLVGPGITGNKLSDPGQESTGYIRIASLSLQSNKAATNFSGMYLYPYTLSFQSSNGRIKDGSDSITIDVNYDLIKDSSYETGDFNHKLILKMTDPYGQSQEKTIILGTDLTEGTHNTYTMTFNSDRYSSLTWGTYRLTLYDEFQGERIELSSQQYALSYDKLPEIEE